jgi:hypothetical protein
MSALASRADICSAPTHVRFVPIADMSSALGDVRFVPKAVSYTANGPVIFQNCLFIFQNCLSRAAAEAQA